MVLGLMSFLVDNMLVEIIPSLRWGPLDELLVFSEGLAVSMLGSVLLSVILGIALLKKGEIIWLPFLLASIVTAAFVAIGLQNAFARPRPGDIELVGVSLQMWKYAFPSGHTAVAFAAVPILVKVLPEGKWAWTGFAFMVSGIRLYMGAHYLSDVIFGAVVGTLVGVTYLNYKFVAEEREIRRQLFHALMGIFLVVAMVKGYLHDVGSASPLDLLFFMPALSRTLLLILAVGAVLVLVSRKHDIPVISHFLDHFERRRVRHEFPGKGCYMFFLGAFIISLVFEVHVVASALLILAIGDSTSHVYGKYFGRIKHPLSKDKNIEGNILGAILSGIAVSLLINPITAFVTAFIVMFVEGIYFSGRLERLNDDNITIPILAAIIIFLMENLLSL